MSAKPRKKAASSIQQMDSVEALRKKRTIIYAVLSILLLTILTYSNSINNGFISNWDDDGYVINNSDIRDLSLSKAIHFFKLDSVYNGNYHPLTMLSYAIEAACFGVASATPFHVTNLLLHLINVCLVFYLMYLITNKLNAAAIVALFFAVHPVHVESVAWVSERKDVLYALFYLASIIFYVKYLRGKSGYKYLSISLVLFVASCLSKSMAVSLPVVLLLCDYLFSRKLSKASVAEKIPYFLIAVLFGIAALKSQSQAMSTGIAQHLGSIDRIFIILHNLIFYPVMLICPWSLSAIHYYPSKTGGLLPFMYYLAPVALLAVSAFVCRAKSHRREIIFGLLFYAATISLVIQIIPIGLSMVSERYAYVPSIGLFFIIGIAFSRLAEKQETGSARWPYQLSTVMIVVFVALFVLLSTRQNSVWKDGITLFTQVIERFPGQSHSYLARGVAKMDANDYAGALEDYSSAIGYDARNAEAYSNRSAIEYMLKRYELSFKDCSKAITLKPDYAEAHNNCGLALLGQGNYRESLNYFFRATALNPRQYGAFNGIAIARSFLGDYKEALAACNKAIELNPNFADAYLSKGNILQAMDDAGGALENYTRAVELDARQYKALRNRGLLYLARNNYRLAAEDLRKAVSIDPGNADDFYDLGVAYYNLSQAKSACENWKIASSKGHREAEAMVHLYCR
jgi:protein O-mannosyl-transferase